LLTKLFANYFVLFTKTCTQTYFASTPSKFEAFIGFIKQNQVVAKLDLALIKSQLV